MSSHPIGPGRGYAPGTGLDCLGASVEFSSGLGRVKADGIPTSYAVAITVGTTSALLYLLTR